MSFNSSIDLLLRYQKSRVPWRVFASLALFLCVASATGCWPIEVAEWCLRWILALCLVVQFRLWDDLADVESDRVLHPSRVLCQAHSHQVFWRILGTLWIVNSVLIATFKSYTSLGVFLVLNVAYVLWYSMPRKVSNDHVIVHSMVLVKYPVFVFLLNGSHTDTRLGLSHCYGMLATFLCFCAYELQHDERLRVNRHVASLLACEFSTLWFVGLLMLIDLQRHAPVHAFVQASLLAAGGIALAILFRQFRVRTTPRWCQFGVFFVTFAWLLNFALGSGMPNGSPHSSAEPRIPTKHLTGTRI